MQTAEQLRAWSEMQPGFMQRLAAAGADGVRLAVKHIDDDGNTVSVPITATLDKEKFLTSFATDQHKSFSLPDLLDRAQLPLAGGLADVTIEGKPITGAFRLLLCLGSKQCLFRIVCRAGQRRQRCRNEG